MAGLETQNIAVPINIGGLRKVLQVLGEVIASYSLKKPIQVNEVIIILLKSVFCIPICYLFSQEQKKCFKFRFRSYILHIL